MATSFLVFGSALMPTSQASISVTTPPTFSGVSGLVAQLNGSLFASWSAATFAATPGYYEVFIQASTATGLFNAANLALSTYGTSIYIFQLASGVLLVNGTTYYVGVRAIDAVGNVDSNVVSLNAVSSGVQPGRSLAPSDISTIVASIWNELQSGHTTAGSFGAYLNATVGNLASQSSVNNIPVNPLLTTDARLNTLDANISSRASQTSVNTLTNTIGTPANSTVSADIAQVEANIVSIGNGLDILYEVSPIEIPSSGSKTIPILIRFAKKSASASVDPDSSAVNVSISNAAGSSVLASTAMTKINTGIYRYDLVITSSFAPQMLIVAFSFSYMSTPFVRSQVIEALPLIMNQNSIIGTLGTPAGASVSADIATRASQSSVNAIQSTIGTPAGASVSADIASVKSDSSGLRADYTTARAANLDFLDIAISSRVATSDSRLTYLDASVSSRATQTQVLAIPTTPQLASVALSQYNALVAAIGSIQNNSNFSGVVPQIMDEQYGTDTEPYTFYASVFSNTNTPIDPDSQILNFTVKDNMNNILQAQTAMTRVSTGQYIGTFTVTAAMSETDVVVFFDYALSSVAYEQVRTSKIVSTATDSANIAAIKAKTDLLPADPASNTVVNTRASQSSVNAIPTNPLLTTDSRLNYIDAAISSRSTQTSVNAIPTNPLLTTDSRLNYLDANVSATATASSLATLTATIGTPAGASVSADIAALQSSVTARPTLTQIVNGVWDENVESHLSGTSTGRTIKDAKVFAQIGL